MAWAAKKVLEHALALPEEDRRSLAEALLESAPRRAPDEVEHAWVEVARRRAEELERGDAQTLDLDDALAELSADLRRIHAE